MARKQKMPVLTQKWIAALRSGKYAQTTGCLKNDEGFCCLGVAADVMAPKAWLKTKNGDGKYRFRHSTNALFIPESDWERLVPKGVRIKNPYYSGDDEYEDEFVELELLMDHMSDLNDEMNLNFNEIADIIESWWSDNPVDPSDVSAVSKFFAEKNRAT